MTLEKNAIAKFPLRLMPSIRKNAERLSAKEGVSLNQFINVAVAERLAHLDHEEWLNRRASVTKATIEEGLRILHRGGPSSPEPGDELPRGYRRGPLKKRMPQSKTGRRAR
jgi:hypothetical protein